MTNVLLIGLHPDVVDLSAMPDLTKEKLAAALDREEQSLRAAGFQVRWLLTDAGATAESVVRATLAAETFDVVLVGAGVRVLPPYFHLFEHLINAIHEGAPRSKIAFNTRPDDTLASVMRWAKP